MRVRAVVLCDGESDGCHKEAHIVLDVDPTSVPVIVESYALAAGWGVGIVMKPGVHWHTGAVLCPACWAHHHPGLPAPT